MSQSAARVSSEKALAMGDKAYKCLYEGCGRLYTTQHHLKVVGLDLTSHSHSLHMSQTYIT